MRDSTEVVRRQRDGRGGIDHGGRGRLRRPVGTNRSAFSAPALRRNPSRTPPTSLRQSSMCRRSPPSAPTAATWRSSPTATNLVPGDTNGAPRRLRPGPAHRRPPPGSACRQHRRPGERRQLHAGDQRRRPLRRLHLGRGEPGARRHEQASTMCSSATGVTGTTTRVSVSSTGAQGNDDSFEPCGQRRRPVRGRSTRSRRTWCPATRTPSLMCSSGTGARAPTTRVSVSTRRRPGERRQLRRRRSAPTAATSPSTRTRANLVPGDTNTSLDVFVRDRRGRHHAPGQRRQRRRPGERRQLRAAISADGRYVAFDSVRGQPRPRRHQHHA